MGQHTMPCSSTGLIETDLSQIVQKWLLIKKKKKLKKLNAAGATLFFLIPLLHLQFNNPAGSVKQLFSVRLNEHQWAFCLTLWEFPEEMYFNKSLHTGMSFVGHKCLHFNVYIPTALALFFHEHNTATQKERSAPFLQN